MTGNAFVWDDVYVYVNNFAGNVDDDDDDDATLEERQRDICVGKRMNPRGEYDRRCKRVMSAEQTW